MDSVRPLVNLDYLTIFFGLYAILIGVQKILELFSWYKRKFRLKTGVEEDKENVEARFNAIDGRFASIENRLESLEKHSKEQDAKFDKMSETLDRVD